MGLLSPAVCTGMESTASHWGLSLQGPCPQRAALATCRGLRPNPCWTDSAEHIQDSSSERGLTEVTFLYLDGSGLWSDFSHLITPTRTCFKTGDQLVDCFTPLGQFILCWPFLSQPLLPPPPCHPSHWRGVTYVFKLLRAGSDHVLGKTSNGLASGQTGQLFLLGSSLHLPLLTSG